MRPITRSLFRILASEKLLPVDFLEIKPLGATAASLYRFTSFGENVTWDGFAYKSISMTRGSINEVLAAESSDQGDCTVTVTNIDLGMAALLNTTELTGATAWLYLADRRLLARKRDAMLMARGEITNPQLTNSSMVFTISNIMGMTNRVNVPRRMFQYECNYVFGSRACGINLDKPPYSIAGTVQANSSADWIVVADAVLTAAGSPASPNDYWAAGYFLLTSGTGELQARPISAFSKSEGDNRFYLTRPFLAAPLVGDSFTLRRGCNKSKADCKERGNLPNYGGFTEVPYERVTPLELEDRT